MGTSILCIQFRKSEIALSLEQKSITREIGEGIEVVFVSGLDEKASWDAPDVLMGQCQGLILGGSGDFDFDGNRDEHDPARKMSFVLLERLRPLLLHIFTHDIPTLGICYGHQMLGAHKGAVIHSDSAQRKTRSHEVTCCNDSVVCPLLFDIPKTFKAQYGHKDVVACIPKDAVLLIEGGEACCVSALRYKNNIYSTQFHPELNVSDLEERMSVFPGYLPEGVTAQEVLEETFEANKILQNFGKLVKDR